MKTALSQFLPPAYDPEKPIVLIAGSGVYPLLMAEAIRKHRLKLCIIGFEGETDPILLSSFQDQDTCILKVGQVGKLLNALKTFRASYAVMAGQIRPKKLFRGMQPDFKALALLARLKTRNAETIFGALAAEIEKQGVRLLDARAFMDEHLATAGLMVKGEALDKDTMAYGVTIAKALAKLDIGQGIVVSEGTVIAVEAFEGTNAMLQRAGALGAKRPIFIKTAKPGQDFRFDVPVIGLQTLDVLQAAHIRQIALEAGNTLILEKEKVFQQAKAYGMTLWGYTPSLE